MRTLSLDENASTKKIISQKWCHVMQAPQIAIQELIGTCLLSLTKEEITEVSIVIDTAVDSHERLNVYAAKN